MTNKKHINIAMNDFLSNDYELLSIDYDVIVNDDFSINSLIKINGFYIDVDYNDVEITICYNIDDVNNEIIEKRVYKDVLVRMVK